MISKTFTAASSAISTFMPIDVVPASKRSGPQFLRVFANGNNSGGSAVLTLVLVKAGAVVWSTTATVTPTARRTSADNSSGNYTCTIAFSESGNSTADLMGSSGPTGGGRSTAGLNSDDSGYVWMLGVTTLTTFTSLVVLAETSYDAR